MYMVIFDLNRAPVLLTIYLGLIFRVNITATNVEIINIMSFFSINI